MVGIDPGDKPTETYTDAVAHRRNQAAG